jgi:RimJ/RimL family protein N-acetyltransferase
MANTTAEPTAASGESTPLAPPEIPPIDERLTLRDGATLYIRAIRPDDTGRLRAFHASLSFESIVFRFFRAVPELPQELAERFTHVDYNDRMALVATRGESAEDEILAVARYDRTGAQEAEVAFVVQDRWQGHGIATALLYRLAAYARAHDITTFVAYTLGTNQPMLDVFRYCGFPHTSRYRDGEVEVRLDISADVRAPLPHKH